jgi:hypothetical protein
MFIKLASFPQSHFHLDRLFIFPRGHVLKHCCFDRLVSFIPWSECRNIKVCLFYILDDFFIKLIRLIIILNGDKQVLLIELDTLKLGAMLQHQSILLRTDDPLMHLHLLLPRKCFHINLFLLDFKAE